MGPLGLRDIDWTEGLSNMAVEDELEGDSVGCVAICSYGQRNDDRIGGTVVGEWQLKGDWDAFYIIGVG